MSHHTITLPGTPTLPSNRRLLALAAIVALLVVGMAVWKLATAAAPAHQPKITVQARNADISTVLRDVASQSGAVLALDPNLTGTVSLETKNAKLADLMNDFCTAYSCNWTFSTGATPALVVKRSSPPPADRTKS